MHLNIFKIFGCNFPIWISEDTLTLFLNNRQTTCPQPLRKPEVVRERGRCLEYMAREPEPFISALLMLVNILVPFLRKSAISCLCICHSFRRIPHFCIKCRNFVIYQSFQIGKKLGGNLAFKKGTFKFIYM